VNLYEVGHADVPSSVAVDVLREAGFDLRFAYVGDDPEPKILVMGTEMTRLCAEAVVLDLSESKATPS
jgi:hypothetical protein